MSNVQSATSLQKSVVTYSVPKESRFQPKSYAGYDSFFYQPPSEFKDRSSTKQYIQKHGIGVAKGTTFGKSERVDFSKPFKDNPGPSRYQPSILKDKFSSIMKGASKHKPIYSHGESIY